MSQSLRASVDIVVRPDSTEIGDIPINFKAYLVISVKVDRIKIRITVPLELLETKARRTCRKDQVLKFLFEQVFLFDCQLPVLPVEGFSFPPPANNYATGANVGHAWPGSAVTKLRISE